MGAFVGLIAGIGILLLWHAASGAPLPARRTALGERTRELLAQSGLRSIRPSQIVFGQALVGTLIGTLALAATGSISVSAVFAVFAGYLPRLVLHRMRRRRQSDLRDVWPDVVDNLISGVRAGLALPDALAAIGQRGPQQIRQPFRQFGSDYRTTGRFTESLDRLREELADPVGDRVCESLRVAREVGGTDLGRLLTTLSAFLRDDQRTRSELLARQQWSVNAARLAAGAPWFVLVLLASQRETLAAYDTPAGTAILAVGAVLTVLAYRLMLRIGRLPQERRILR